MTTTTNLEGSGPRARFYSIVSPFEFFIFSSRQCRIQSLYYVSELYTPLSEIFSSRMAEQRPGGVRKSASTRKRLTRPTAHRVNAPKARRHLEKQKIEALEKEVSEYVSALNLQVGVLCTHLS